MQYGTTAKQDGNIGYRMESFEVTFFHRIESKMIWSLFGLAASFLAFTGIAKDWDTTAYASLALGIIFTLNIMTIWNRKPVSPPPSLPAAQRFTSTTSPSPKQHRQKVSLKQRRSLSSTSPLVSPLSSPGMKSSPIKRTADIDRMLEEDVASENNVGETLYQANFLQTPGFIFNRV
jgi:hypothetical protein